MDDRYETLPLYETLSPVPTSIAEECNSEMSYPSSQSPSIESEKY